MADDRIKEIQERVDKASKGPWIVRGEGDLMHVYNPNAAHHYYGREIISDEDYDTKEADMEFIAHAREDIPHLLDELDKTKAEMVRQMTWKTEAQDQAEDLEDENTKLKGKLGFILHTAKVTPDKMVSLTTIKNIISAPPKEEVNDGS